MSGNTSPGSRRIVQRSSNGSEPTPQSILSNQSGRKKLRVVIVDETHMTRDMMRTMLAPQLGIEVVGESMGPDAVDLIKSMMPDVVVLEMRVGGVDALEIVERVRRAKQYPAFLVVSAQCDEVTAHRIEKARIHGFVDKRAEMFEALSHALREISEGRRYFSPTWMKLRESRVSNPFSYDKILTARQLEVLTLVARFIPDELIIKQLRISRCTLRGHRRVIASKFNVPVKELARFAREKGFGGGC